MMTVDSTREIQTTTGAATLDGAAAAGSDTLGRNEFLRLLTVQLSHQDPLKPVTNEAFIAQLAQFSSLEEMQKMSRTLETSQLLDQSINNVLAAGLIGREVRATGNVVELRAGAPVDFFVGLDRAARVQVTVRDGAGNAVRQLALGRLGAGQNRVVWDGRDDAGGALAAGSYSLSVTAIDDRGQPALTQTGTLGEVTALRFRDGRAYVVVAGREVPIDEVMEIRSAD